jgi:3-oxoadipate enol-lactonase
MKRSDDAVQAPATHLTKSLPRLRVALQGVPVGHPVILSHALGLDTGMWDTLAAELAPRYRVLRYDHRGHGRSDVPPGPYTMDDLVDDAARVVQEWGVGPVAWIGLSMGAMVGMGLAIRRPELVHSLVLANTTSRYPPEARTGWSQRIAAVEAGGMAQVVDMVLQRYLHADFRARQWLQVAGYRDTILRCDPQGYAACCHAVASVDWFDRLGRVAVPTLIIAGAEDVGAPPQMAHAMKERISNARLEVLEKASHLSVAEQPVRFESLVNDFLDATTGRH